MQGKFEVLTNFVYGPSSDLQNMFKGNIMSCADFNDRQLLNWEAHGFIRFI